jgi:uncharacterized coiled-coil protein SlyX
MFLRSVPLAFFLAAAFLATAPLSGHAQSVEEVVLYKEDFDNYRAQDWQLDPGWAVTKDGVLKGQGHQWARYKDVDWQDYRVQFQLKIVEAGSRIHLNYRVGQAGRYYIGFYTGGLYLSKESPWGTFYEFLDRSDSQYSIGDWHAVEIVGEGSGIQVFVDGKLELYYTDPDPILSGTIGFETLDTGNIFEVDEIVVTGPRSDYLPDLVVTGADSELFEETLIIVATIENAGEAPVEGGSSVTAETPGWSGRAGVPELGAGEIAEVTITLTIPDELRGQWHSFDVIVDSGYELVESNEDNNRQTIRVWVPGIAVPLSPTTATPAPTAIALETPLPTPVAPEHPEHLLLILIVIVIGIAGGVTLTFKHVIKISIRKEWQKKANEEEEEPLKPCQQCTRHCRKIELEAKPALRKIHHLNLRACDPATGEERAAWQEKGTVVEELNKAVTAHRRRAQPEKLQDQVAHLADTFLHHVMERLHDAPTLRDLALVGHLEGGKLTCKFILYHCIQSGTGTVWKEEDTWTAKLKDEHDEPVGTLYGLNPADPEIPEQLTTELTRLLMQFIEKF